ncbi:hypothetical protein CVT25_013073 [Psilocybe cyanescens]|uniref:Uncharacterized protein n=1 Tax=Psilocybe cyanescens TaxID=93625 RepID=A0A409XWN1_PSICY|nr:hypothetical protein CVT25_013073 [Psilocybe cyanescens]
MVLLGMGVCYLISSAFDIWIVSTGVPITIAVPIPGGTFCVPLATSRAFSRFWIPALLFESMLCGMALYAALRTFKLRGSFLKNSQTLVEILIRDSVFYYLVIAATYIFCLVWWAYAPIGLVEAPIGFSIPLASVLASRILFNLRIAASDNSPIYYHTRA